MILENHIHFEQSTLGTGASLTVEPRDAKVSLVASSRLLFHDSPPCPPSALYKYIYKVHVDIVYIQSTCGYI
jgi:hypothetical protein